jgi:hypothetical protein
VRAFLLGRGVASAMHTRAPSPRWLLALLFSRRGEKESSPSPPSLLTIFLILNVFCIQIRPSNPSEFFALAHCNACMAALQRCAGGGPALGEERCYGSLRI